MKKIIAIILGLAMLLCAVSVTAEGTQEKVTIGTVSINGAFTLQCGIPEGYRNLLILFDETTDGTSGCYHDYRLDGGGGMSGH